MPRHLTGGSTGLRLVFCSWRTMSQGLAKRSKVILRMTVECLGHGRTDHAAIDERRSTYSNLRTTAVWVHERTPHEPLLFWSFVRIDRRLWGCECPRLSDAFVSGLGWVQSITDQLEMAQEIGDYLMLLPRSKLIDDEN
jgi:hypothetical protein